MNFENSDIQFLERKRCSSLQCKAQSLIKTLLMFFSRDENSEYQVTLFHVGSLALIIYDIKTDKGMLSQQLTTQLSGSCIFTTQSAEVDE